MLALAIGSVVQLNVVPSEGSGFSYSTLEGIGATSSGSAA